MKQQWYWSIQFRQFNCRVLPSCFHLSFEFSLGEAAIFGSFSISSIQTNIIALLRCCCCCHCRCQKHESVYLNWSDLPENKNGIETETTGLADARKFVFTWVNECSFKLTEDDNRFLFLQIFHLLNSSLPPFQFSLTSSSSSCLPDSFRCDVCLLLNIFKHTFSLFGI